MILQLLASGSGGNALLIKNGEASVLIDAGLPARELLRRLKLAGAGDLGAIIITHEHLDHLRGAGPLARRLGIPIYINGPTHVAAWPILGRLPEVRRFDVGEPFEASGLSFLPFPAPHDAALPVGFVVEGELGIATDLGSLTPEVRERLSGLKGIIIEFNHDLEMLVNGPYPWPVKERIRGPLGHLSNGAAGRLLREVASPELELVILAHLSQTNNHPPLALDAAERALGERRPRLFAASQGEVSEPFNLNSP